MKKAVAATSKREQPKTVLSGAGWLSSLAGTATSRQPPTERSFSLPDHDGQLYVDARGWKLIYNAVKLLWLWLTRKHREGHWYYDN